MLEETNIDQQRNHTELVKLLDQQWVRPVDRSVHEVTPLSAAEQQVRSKLLDVLISTNNKEQCFSLVFRGEQKQRLQRKLIPIDDYPSFNKLYFRLFSIGDKARHFNKPRADYVGCQYGLQFVDDVSSGVFEFIFDRLYWMFTVLPRSPLGSRVREFGWGNKQKVIDKFKQSNLELVNFFSRPANKVTFINGINWAPDQQAKGMVRDYYLYLLHTFRCKGFSSPSIFVSTSKKRKEAQRFARYGRDGIVLVYLLPEPLHKYGVSRESFRIFQEHCIRLGLPFYETDLYPNQEEIAVKGALFPNFILGFYDLQNSYFIASPYIFNQPDHAFELIPRQGLLIDQSSFEETLLTTRYARYVQRFDDFYSEENLW